MGLTVSNIVSGLNTQTIVSQLMAVASQPLLRLQSQGSVYSTQQATFTQIQTDITILPSCHETDTERVALVQFRGRVPQFLSKLTANPLIDWQMEMGDNDINFDCHFSSFTQLYALVEEPVIAEYVRIYRYI